jgi:prephenate dehydrogenase
VDAVAADPPAAIREADLSVLAGPPLACLDLLDGLAGPWRAAVGPLATITDVASTKAAIVERAAAHGLRFAGGHPMAGRDVSGFEHADPDLFRDRPWVVVPAADPEATAVVRSLARSCGARPIEMTGPAHDAAVAAISHLPLVLAAALVESVAGGAGQPDRADWPDARALAASGWRDMSRLARGDVGMGVGIAATNAPAIAARLRELRSVLDAWLADLEAADGPELERIRARLASTRERLLATDAVPPPTGSAEP